MIALYVSSRVREKKISAYSDHQKGGDLDMSTAGSILAFGHIMLGQTVPQFNYTIVGRKYLHVFV